MLRSLSALFNKKVLLLTHAGCDIDSLGSAAAIRFSLKGKAKISICVPDNLNVYSKKLAENLQIPYKINAPLKGFDAVVCLDFNRPAMLGSMRKEFESFGGEKYLIDHHRKEAEGFVAEKNSCVVDRAISTTELVYDLLKETLGLKIPKKAYACIAAGIITDSASFSVADFETFDIMAQVMRGAQMTYSEITALFYLKKDLSEKIASLKAARRCRIFSSGGAIIAISEVGAFEADAAASLVRIGADVAFCGYADKGKIRVSGRANNNWLKENKFDLTKDVFAKLDAFFAGSGGGHAGAAGFTGEGEEAMPVLQKCAELVNEFLAIKKNGQRLKEYD